MYFAISHLCFNINSVIFTKLTFIVKDFNISENKLIWQLLCNYCQPRQKTLQR